MTVRENLNNETIAKKMQDDNCIDCTGQLLLKKKAVEMISFSYSAEFEREE